MIIDWDDAFDVGIPEIDGQHRDLIETFNRLVETLQSDGGYIHAITLINELTDKAQIHIDFENQLMKTAGYPDSGQHTEEHQNFIKDVNELSRRLLTTGKPSLQKGSLRILGQKLLEHSTQGTDRTFIDYLIAIQNR